MLSTISAALLRFVARFEREEGQALAEYGLILALIAVAAILALTALGFAIAGKMGGIGDKLNSIVVP
jgi:pilus assembly protein Flp/PilA